MRPRDEETAKRYPHQSRAECSHETHTRIVGLHEVLLAQVGVAHRCGFEFESQMILELPPECPQCPLTKQMLPISTLTILPGPQD